jgi:hypothetical protein
MQKEVLHILARYLSAHNLLAIAGVGYLRRVYRPARFVGNQLKGPGSSWFYEADKSVPATDPSLLRWFSATNGTAEQDLQQLFEEVFTAVILKGSYSHPNLGTFVKKEGHIEFLPDSYHYTDCIAFGFESVLVKTPLADQEKQQASEETPTTKLQPVEKRQLSMNQWLKIAAGLLLLISVNFILINYLENTATTDLQLGTLGTFENIDSGLIEETPADSVVDLPEQNQLIENQPALSESIPLLEPKPAVFPLPLNQKFAVIVGAFRDLHNAEGYVKTLKNLGYEARLAGSTSGGLYRVSAGDFDEMKIAESFIETLKTQNQIEGWVMESSR